MTPPPRPGAPAAVLAAAFLFNLGQGVLRPTVPLYLQAVFAANYRMVTAVPAIFGAGKWLASLPAGALLDRIGRRALMASGLGLIACCDVASAATSTAGVFLGLRGLAGVGWAMFGTVATTTMVERPGGDRRGRTVSLLLIGETSGLLLGSAVGGWLYQAAGLTSPLLFEAGCMAAAAGAVILWVAPSAPGPGAPRPSAGRGDLGAVVRTPGVMLMGATSAALIAVQTGALVFLAPLYLAGRPGLPPEAVGAMVSLGVAGRLPALWLGGSLSDRRDRMAVLAVGLLTCACLLASLPLLAHPLALAAWSLAMGGAAGFVAPLPTAVVGDRVAPPRQGLAIGWLRTMTDTGHVLGPLALGALADGAGLTAAFLAGAAALLAAAWRCRRAASAGGRP